MKRGILAGLLALSVLTGCASTVAKILPFGEPVTKERCEAFSVHDFGVKDGAEARKRGERFESWQGDCRAFGVKFDRAEYERGYDEGLANYCSCEKGFTVGVKGGFAELRGQYFMCESKQYAHFHRGFAEGKKLDKDETLVRKVNEIKTEYDEKLILERATFVCANLPQTQARQKADRLHIGLTIEARKKISGPSVIAHLEYTNGTKEPVRFVNWVLGRGQAPTNKIFEVTQNGKEVAYTGIMAKRMPPGEADFIVLKPGESLRDSIDLSQAYAWSLSPGRYDLYLETSAQEPGVERRLRSEDASFSF
ncbi:MAG: DUF2799 domain-containing protein [Bdellovibrionaceae bacterium]|nr:DUF2799 domain-containing protein [Pseudobdellovibrionaceae bacterium]